MTAPHPQCPHGTVNPCHVFLIISLWAHECRHALSWDLGTTFDAADGSLRRKDVLAHARAAEPMVVVARKLTAWMAVRFVGHLKAHDALIIGGLERITPRELGVNTSLRFGDCHRTNCCEVILLGLLLGPLLARLE